MQSYASSAVAALIGLAAGRRDSKHALDRIARGRSATFGIYDVRSFDRPLAITSVPEDPRQHLSSRVGIVIIPPDRFRNAESAAARSVVGLIVTEGHDQVRYAGTKHLARCADSALVDNARGFREYV